MSQSWKFIMSPRTANAPQSWSWVKCRAGRGVQQSGATFVTFLGCVTDARLAGFGVTDPFDIIRERRRTPRDTARAEVKSPAYSAQSAAG